MNSSFSFDVLISWKAFEHQRPWMKDAGWGNYLYATYVLLRPGAAVAATNAKLRDLLRQYDPGDKEIRLFLYPFVDLHLYNEFKDGMNVGGRIAYVRLFLVLAIGILLIACINFMNLSTARSAKRAREVGVWKTMGAAKGAHVIQFLGESMSLSFAAFILALGLSAILLPVIHRFLGLQLSLPYDNGWAWIIGLWVTALTGVLAGSYPAFFLSSFDPIRVLKGQFTAMGTAVRLMRLKQPLGQEITWQGQKRRIIGVVKDFVWGSPFEPVKPAVVGFQKDWVGNIGLRLNPDRSLSKSLAQLSALYKQYNPAYPFEYRFTNDDFSKKFSDEKLLGAISLGFTTLAVLIAALGLFGLAAFSAEQRTREIGIRKVLGAGVPRIVGLLTQEFLKLVLIAFVLAAALSWYYIHRWLDHYAYHTSFSGGILALTLVASVALCLAAVITQAVRAARANPVKSLRGD